jgi:hypothetical protein
MNYIGGEATWGVSDEIRSCGNQTVKYYSQE